MPSCSIAISCNWHARAKGIFLLVFFRSSCGRNCWNQNATVLSVWGHSQHSLQDGIYQWRWSAVFNSSIKQWAMSWCHFRFLSWLSLEGWVCFRPSWLRNSGLQGTEDEVFLYGAWPLEHYPSEFRLILILLAFRMALRDLALVLVLCVFSWQCGWLLIILADACLHFKCLLLSTSQSHCWNAMLLFAVCVILW